MGEWFVKFQVTPQVFSARDDLKSIVWNKTVVTQCIANAEPSNYRVQFANGCGSSCLRYSNHLSQSSWIFHQRLSHNSYSCDRKLFEWQSVWLLSLSLVSVAWCCYVVGKSIVWQWIKPCVSICDLILTGSDFLCILYRNKIYLPYCVFVVSSTCCFLHLNHALYLSRKSFLRQNWCSLSLFWWYIQWILADKTTSEHGLQCEVVSHEV